MTLNIEKIKAAAMAATQGEWGSYGPIVYLPHGLGRFNIHDCVNPDPNAAHIALANPQAVLELIARLEAAELALVTENQAYINYAHQVAHWIEKFDAVKKKLEAAENDAARFRWLAGTTSETRHTTKRTLVGPVEN